MEILDKMLLDYMNSSKDKDKSNPWLIIHNTEDDFYTLTSKKVLKEMKHIITDNDIIIERLDGRLSIEEAQEKFNRLIELYKNITSAVIENNIEVGIKMTKKEKMIAELVSNKWIEWIKNNCKMI